MFGRLGHVIKRFGLTDQSYRFLFEAEPGNEAVSLDCETTGFDPWVDEIVSIAAISITGRRIQASSAYRALVKPEGTMRPDSIKVHQLRQQDVAQARPMTDVLPELLHFIGSRPLVGYWIQFDVRMLDRYLLAALLRSQIRNSAARHARRFALCGDSGRSEIARAPATRCLRGRARRGRNVRGARGYARARRAAAAATVRDARQFLHRLSEFVAGP